jgi:hypothetical protein
VDSARWSVELLKLVVHLPTTLPVEPGPTMSMTAVTALGVHVTGSVWALFLLCMVPSFLGKWALYVGMRDELRPKDPRPLLVSALLIPSCVFWSSGLVKEAFTIAGLGALFRGTQLLMRHISFWGAVLVVYGAALVGAFKPFFLFSFLLGTVLWIVFAKIKQAPGLAPFVLLGAGVIAVVGVAFLGTKYEEFALENVTESIARHQQYGAIAAEGSSYAMGDAEARSPAAQAAYAPLALATTLFRPLPFEIRNMTSAIAAAELALLTYLLVTTLRRVGVRRASKKMLESPVLIFALAFTLVSATGVGLATTNFGTLSRYRTPLLPFYAVLIVAVRAAWRREEVRSALSQAMVANWGGARSRPPSAPELPDERMALRRGKGRARSS